MNFARNMQQFCDEVGTLAMATPTGFAAQCVRQDDCGIRLSIGSFLDGKKYMNRHDKSQCCIRIDSAEGASEWERQLFTRMTSMEYEHISLFVGTANTIFIGKIFRDWKWIVVQIETGIDIL